MLPVAQIEKLKRFDRRFFVEEEPARAGTYRVAYHDAIGLKVYALREVREITAPLFEQLYRSAPWKRLESVYDAVDEMDRKNEALRASEDPDMQRVHEDAWDDVVFLRGRQHLC